MSSGIENSIYEDQVHHHLLRPVASSSSSSSIRLIGGFAKTHQISQYIALASTPTAYKFHSELHPWCIERYLCRPLSANSDRRSLRSLVRVDSSTCSFCHTTTLFFLRGRPFNMEWLSIEPVGHNHRPSPTRLPVLDPIATEEYTFFHLTWVESGAS